MYLSLLWMYSVGLLNSSLRTLYFYPNAIFSTTNNWDSTYIFVYLIGFFCRILLKKKKKPTGPKWLYLVQSMLPNQGLIPNLIVISTSPRNMSQPVNQEFF